MKIISILKRNEYGDLDVWLSMGETVRPEVVSLPGKMWSFSIEKEAITHVLTPTSWMPGSSLGTMKPQHYHFTFADSWHLIPSYQPSEQELEELGVSIPARLIFTVRRTPAR